MTDTALATATVVWRARAVGQDTDDPSGLPDEYPLAGVKVRLIPSPRKIEVAAPPGGVAPTTYTLRTWDLVTCADGSLVNLEDAGGGIQIVASDAIDGVQIEWTSIIDAPDSGVPAISKVWLAPAGQVVDLTTVVSIPPSPDSLADYLQAVRDARAARDIAVASGAVASAAAERAEIAAQGMAASALSLALTGLPPGPIAMPSEFAPTLPCTFTRGSDGVVTHDMDFAPYRTAPTVLWVASVTGSNTTGTGAEGSPYRSMSKAWDVALAGSGDVVIKTTDAFMDRDFSIVSSARTITDRRISVIGAGAAPTTLSAANAALSWTDDAGAWKATRSACRAVYSATLDANGVPVPIPAASSLANCQSTPNSWWTDNTSVWINTGGVAPTTATHHVCVVVTLFGVTLLGSAELYVENVTFLGGHESAVSISGGATSQGKFIANNVRFVGGDRRPITTGAFGNALTISDISRSLLFGCVAAHATRDGFNYHYLLVAAPDRRDRMALEYGCLSYGHGAYNTESNNNATTAHEGVVTVRINCEGYGTSGPVLADVGGCLSVLIDCHMHDSALSNKEIFLYVDSPGQVWMHNCKGGGVGAYDLAASATVPVTIAGRFAGHRVSAATVINWA